MNNITLSICTEKINLNKLKKNSYLKKINKLIKCEYISIDDLIIYLKKSSKNKYQLLACIQNIMINYAKFKDYKFFMTMYPDFIFKKNTIEVLLRLINKKKCDVLIPIPQLVKEKIDTIFDKNGIRKILHNLEDINFKHLHEIILNNDINNINTNTPSLFCDIQPNYINFSNYHLHPILIKLSLNRYKYTAFTKSLDEDFIKSISYEKNYYVVKNSNEMLMNSLLGENELELKKQVL